MKYECKICNFETNRKANYNDHIETIKHKNNKKLNSNKYKCELCNKGYATKANYDKHINKCQNRQSNMINDKVQNDITELKESFKNNEDYIRIICTGAIKVANNTLSTMSFLTNFMTNAPALNTNIDFKAMLCRKEDNDFKTENEMVLDIIIFYKNKILVQFLGDIIIESYKKNKPEEQSLWNSDVARLNYIIRELVNNKLMWTRDSQGIKVNELIIYPLLEVIRKSLVKYKNQQLSLQNISNTEKDINFNHVDNYLNIVTVSEIIKDIDELKLNEEINKYISPYFYFDKRKFKLDLESNHTVKLVN